MHVCNLCTVCRFILNQNAPDVKYLAAKNYVRKRAQIKRCEIKLGGQTLLLLKFLIMMTTHKTFFVSQNVLWPCHRNQNFISSTAGGLGHPI